jgi:hypothetical protein
MGIMAVYTPLLYRAMLEFVFRDGLGDIFMTTTAQLVARK